MFVILWRCSVRDCQVSVEDWAHLEGEERFSQMTDTLDIR